MNIKVALIALKENLGFGKANNLASHKARGEYLLFLNPDTKLLDNFVPKMLAYLKVYPNIGIIAPKLINEDGTTQNSVRRLPTILGALKEYYLKQRYAYEAYAPKENHPIEIESAVGAAFAIKKELFLSLGGFDEKYFMFYEDLALCQKVREKGYKVIYFPQARIEHSIGRSTTVNPKSYQLLQHSAVLFHGYFNYLILRVLLKGRRLLTK